MDHRPLVFIGGEWVRPVGDDLLTVINPSTEECVSTVAACQAEDVDSAVGAAARSLPEWSATPVGERADAVRAVGKLLESRAEELADAISEEMGMPRHLCPAYQVHPAVSAFVNAADAAGAVRWVEQVGHSSVRREPAGVVAAITPWNYPLLQIATKVAFALVAGCPVVLKPSEMAPLDAFLLADAIEECGLPAGVFNLVPGLGTEVGEALATHPDVAMVSLTGSTRAGRRVAELASASLKRVALELGGKSPSVVLDDADVGTAARCTVASIMVNTGQTCTALSRLVVPADRLREVESAVVDMVAEFRVGPSTDPTSDVGPLANSPQLSRVRQHVELAKAQGVRRLPTRTTSRPASPGYFFDPVVFTSVGTDVPVARDEVFGPVLCIQPYDGNDDEAIRIANATSFGLAASVWSSDRGRAERAARAIDAGTVDINGAPFNDRAPFGGCKQSGYGRELGVWGIEEFTRLKSVQA